MRRTSLCGHALRREGKAFTRRNTAAPWESIRGHIGRGLCECGEASEVEWTDAARKRWHAAHKAEVSTATIPNRQEGQA
jgi:hypothetical protein